MPAAPLCLLTLQQFCSLGKMWCYLCAYFCLLFSLLLIYYNSILFVHLQNCGVPLLTCLGQFYFFAGNGGQGPLQCLLIETFS